MRVGIPRSLFYYYYGDIWKNFFDSLKISYIESPKTNQEIIDRGIKMANDEMCLSLKNYLGHIDYLKDKCDYILVPRISNFKNSNQTCTNFWSAYDIVKNLFPVNILHYNIDLEKDSQLEERIKFLSNIEKVKEAVTSSMEALSDGEISATELIEKSIRALSSISNMSNDALKAEEFLNAALANITEAQSYITGLINEEDEENSSDDLNQLIDRKYKLQDICKRYGGSLESAIEYMKKLENDLAGMDNQDDMLASLEKEVEELHKEAKKSADVLNDARKKVSVEICNKTVKILEELELKSAKFEVKFKDNESLDYQAGISAEFYISTNAGFQTAPLATVASGGEVSRVMLALKEVFADYDNVGTMLFDEIDTGISGKAAQSVARKLKELSKKKQIIVITHLPVVAAMGDSHFHISKSDKDGISSTNILKLDKASKINIIATMISGEATPTALQQAEDMINRGSI